MALTREKRDSTDDYEKEEAMLVVNIEIWPWGREERKYKIGEITVGNVAGGRISSYKVRVQQAAYELEGIPAIDEEFMLCDHDRGAGAMALIRDALLIAVPPPEKNAGRSGAGIASAAPEE